MTKLEAANRQLAMAIRLFLNDCDPVSVHTLICAAREIFEKHLSKGVGERMFDLVKIAMPERDGKEIGNLINRARNFFKHPGDSLVDELDFSDEDNDVQIIFAVHDSTELSNGNPIPEVRAMNLWFSLTGTDGRENIKRDPLEGLSYKDFDARYPGLRNASREERKRFGRSLFSDGCMLSGLKPISE